MGQVIHLHHAGIFGRRVPVEAPFVRREVITTPSAQPAAVTPEAAGVYLASLPRESLTPRQARELALITASYLAKDEDARALLLRKADQVALGIPAPMSLPPVEAIDPVCSVQAVADGGGIDVRRKPVTLVPWILGLLAVAALLSVLPPLFS
ncbi:hypothetical protein ABI_15260 [Asticcacaulis biprosthecium C19]|uniref:Transmembrane protein n=1 Tax=Asticcacaulis biprosthecium C19 TaxID=715226 RepID=F4QJ23_9CAUL|nr:hypothetical protein [Asticcacaulis biprosthecium]EGF93086.1 hypothetical protein ABI_15260 [Asticcacaulis biprosthecium C19]